jgi:membrane-associated phospholipid phosphatase
MRPDTRSPWVWLPPVLALVLLIVLAASAANRSLFLLLNRIGHPLGETLWLHLTMLGDGAVALALVLPAIRRSPRCFWGALIAAVFATLWVQVLKQTVSVPRPLAVLAAEEFFQSGPAYRAVSFPSGHAAAIFAIAGIWIMALPGRAWLRWALLLLATLVSLSRVMVGVHWPVDILWGMLGGWMGAWSGLTLYARYQWKTSGTGGLIAGMVLLIVAAALLVSDHMHIPVALPLQRTLGGICLAWGAWEMFLMLPLMTLRRQSKGEFDGQ